MTRQWRFLYLNLEICIVFGVLFQVFRSFFLLGLKLSLLWGGRGGGSCGNLLRDVRAG